MPDLAGILTGAGVVKRGAFRLASGKTSEFYIDLKSAYGKPQALLALTRALAAVIPKRATVVASGGYGGLPLATAVALHLRLPLTLIRAAPKPHGTAKWLDGYVPTKTDRIALIDDVYTTGGSLRQMERALKRSGARILGTYVVVSRSDRLPRGIQALVDSKRLIA